MQRILQHLTKDNVTVAGEVVKTLAILFGGVWAYWKFVRGRTFRRRLELTISGTTFERQGACYLSGVVQLKNVGLSRVTIEQQGTAIELFRVRDIKSHLIEEDLETLEVFLKHGWIEPGETIEEPFLLVIAEVDETTIGVRLHLRIVSRGIVTRAIEWNAGAVVVVNTQAPTGETPQRSRLQGPTVTLHLNRRSDLTTSQTQEQPDRTAGIQQKKTKQDASP